MKSPINLPRKTSTVAPFDGNNPEGLQQSGSFYFGDDEQVELKHRQMLRKMGASFQNSAVAEVARQMKIVSPHARFIVDPEDRFKKYWSLLIHVLVFYSALVVPFQVAFRATPNFGYNFFDWTVDALFFVDVIINTRSSFMQGGLYVSSESVCVGAIIILQ
ncbi:MAG: hypothetical protein P4L40_08055 [Terracidiphilus sp.]|nr:hypothetical protein [Terracidiphilus sp.]